MTEKGNRKKGRRRRDIERKINEKGEVDKSEQNADKRENNEIRTRRQ